MQKADGLIRALRYHFVTHGAPEELASDGGPEYTATETQEFLKRWGVAHRLSSAYHPQSNLRAELGVKVMKRMLRENVNSQGGLDTDKLARALLAYRNTPNKDLGVSPAQVLYGRVLRDHLPTPKEFLKQRKEWIMLKNDREKALATRYGKMKIELNRRAHEQRELPVGSVVQVQNQRGKDALRWDKSGMVVESLGNQQYTVKMDGSGRVTLRNRRFLRMIQPLIPRNVSLDNVVSSNHKGNTKKDTTEGIDEGNVNDSQTELQQEVPESVRNEEPRRSTRVSQPPLRYESKW